MSGRLETVRVERDHSPGYATINKSDFDPKRDVLYKEMPPELAALVEEALALKVPGPNNRPAARSVLERWSAERLVTAIAEAKV